MEEAKKAVGWLLLPLFVVCIVLLLPFVLLRAITPPEWWCDIHGSSDLAQKANLILWMQLRLGDWY
jgi:hypothetical protein